MKTSFDAGNARRRLRFPQYAFEIDSRLSMAETENRMLNAELHVAGFHYTLSSGEGQMVFTPVKSECSLYNNSFVPMVRVACRQEQAHVKIYVATYLQKGVQRLFFALVIFALVMQIALFAEALTRQGQFYVAMLLPSGLLLYLLALTVVVLKCATQSVKKQLTQCLEPQSHA